MCMRARQRARACVNRRVITCMPLHCACVRVCICVCMRVCVDMPGVGSMLSVAVTCFIAINQADISQKTPMLREISSTEAH